MDYKGRQGSLDGYGNLGKKKRQGRVGRIKHTPQSSTSREWEFTQCCKVEGDICLANGTHVQFWSTKRYLNDLDSPLAVETQCQQGVAPISSLFHWCIWNRWQMDQFPWWMCSGIDNYWNIALQSFNDCSGTTHATPCGLIEQYMEQPTEHQSADCAPKAWNNYQDPDCVEEDPTPPPGGGGWDDEPDEPATACCGEIPCHAWTQYDTPDTTDYCSGVIWPAYEGNCRWSGGAQGVGTCIPNLGNGYPCDLWSSPVDGCGSMDLSHTVGYGHCYDC